MLYLSSLPIKPALPEVAQDILRGVVNVLRLQLPLLARRQSQGQTGQGIDGRGGRVLGMFVKEGTGQSLELFLNTYLARVL